LSQPSERSDSKLNPNQTQIKPVPNPNPRRSGKVQVLVASDVASRGLDIRGLPYVVNYDFPSRLEVYVHRWVVLARVCARMCAVLRLCWWWCC